MAGDEQLRRLSADLTSAGREVGNRALQVVRKTAYDIETTAKSIVAVDTGNLKSSITHSDPRMASTGSLAAEIGPTADYGEFLETGTRRMAPQPFMGPAADRHEPAFNAAMAQLGQELLDG